MKVEIRTKPLANGNQSIYLDFYDKGKRWYEYLKLYLTPEVDENSKMLNKNAMDRAIAIKAERILNIQKEEQIKEDALPVCLLSDYMDSYLGAIDDTTSQYRSTRSFINIVKIYLNHIKQPRLLLSKIDKNFYKGLLRFLQHTYKNTKAKDNPKPLSEHTLLLNQTIMNAMINKAVKDGLMIENPFYMLDQKERIAKVPSNRTYLSREEVQKLESVEEGSMLTKQAFLFCCFTGLRHSDLSALTWGDIKYTGSGLSIVLPQMKKTRKSLYVPLNKKALEWMPERGINEDFMPIFAVPCLSSCDRSLKRLAKRAGIEKNISFHTSRHTFATLSLAASGDIYTVGKLLGHTSVKSTQIYADVLQETKMEAINNLDMAFG